MFSRLHVHLFVCHMLLWLGTGQKKGDLTGTGPGQILTKGVHEGDMGSGSEEVCDIRSEDSGGDGLSRALVSSQNCPSLCLTTFKETNFTTL
jgi:hypothetical protein